MLYPGVNKDYPTLRNYYYQLVRFERNKKEYGFTTREYVTYIENYYSKKAYEKLIEQLKFEVEYVKTRPAYELLNMFLDTLHRAYITPYWHGSDALSLTLDGFGLYSGNFCYAVGTPNTDIVDLLDYRKTDDYKNMAVQHHIMEIDNMKNKKKNDSLNYLQTNNLITYE